ncbi:hypothetical protein QFC21_003725 [Naganishia friedmannii]|uniref:Uncharacterized protein n=1 Tax=Naganishia friedmannii TaxID=89922 RepID=A0ACC2VP66_9TREE|nr:hypothetical protein QFC21_003725 [Naganishia friedmannii]
MSKAGTATYFYRHSSTLDTQGISLRQFLYFFHPFMHLLPWQGKERREVEVYPVILVRQDDIVRHCKVPPERPIRVMSGPVAATGNHCVYEDSPQIEPFRRVPSISSLILDHCFFQATTTTE